MMIWVTTRPTKNADLPSKAPDRSTSHMTDPVNLAQSILHEQRDAISTLADSLDAAFASAVRLINDSDQTSVVTGIGKSGLIARKAAATLASTGTPAIFMHPVEGLHGDLGAVSPGAVLLALSKSGETEELTKFVHHFRRIGGRVVAVCESASSPLAQLADVHLMLPKLPEAGPLGLAPTTSTLMTLALCDALAMVLLDQRGFREEDFANYHPDGSLGRRLLLRTSDLMHGGSEMPVVRNDAGFNELLLEITNRHLGMTCVVDDRGLLIGVFTDGDLRRLLTRCEKPGALSAGEAWRLSRREPNEPQVACSTVSPKTLAVDCRQLMRDSEITVLVVSDDGQTPLGVVRLQDIVRAGLG